MLKRIMPVLLLGVALLFSVIAVRAAVDLTYFDGVWTSNGSRLFWGTASEDDSQGFYLWRSTQDLQVVNGALNTSQATRVSAFIPGASGGCDPNGHDYEYLDTTANPAEPVYYYFLESLNCSNGGSVFYGNNGNLDGSGVVIFPGQVRLYLPLVAR
ncbi:MAG: hypothetical protein KDD73_00405 [Anaerolineales bacterium]|nr:hypothetical protein [Anaerolineales bacterium]MCB9127909.1 hypothetical protein [Ardenticatenales bacterium]